MPRYDANGNVIERRPNVAKLTRQKNALDLMAEDAYERVATTAEKMRDILDKMASGDADGETIDRLFALSAAAQRAWTEYGKLTKSAEKRSEKIESASA